MGPSIEALPIELIEQIVQLLDLCSIASLRLTSRNMERKASQGYFTKFFHTKDMALTPRTLQNMIWITSQDHVGGLLQHCNIVGIAEIDMITQSHANELTDLLATAFLNLKERCKNGGLASLCLRVATIPQDSNDQTAQSGASKQWKDIWATALCTFNITIAALERSQLSVDDSLDVFGSVKGCSLRCDVFLLWPHSFPSTPIFAKLRRLTVSLSSSCIGFEEQATPGEERDYVPSSNIFRGILEMSRIMPQLESINLHWYRLGYNVTTLTKPFIDTSGSSTFTHLKELILRGMHTSANNLLQFIRELRPTSLTMKDITLTSRVYDPIFEYITSPESPMAYYCLDDIHHDGRLVHFNIPGHPKYPHLFQYMREGVHIGPSTLIQGIEDVKEPISYLHTRLRLVSSPQMLCWRSSKRSEYGPPDSDYDFVKLNAPKPVVSN
ncbi:hypothetical protein F5B19DRAFT_379928 [Rostrohypoxylon terebratum]|nr:hypothetical protein F5B19DRAFT_379928 [Rostrohypoxylon terebratum]